MSTIKPPLYAVKSASLSKSYLKVPAHVGPDPLVVEEALDAADGADGDVLVPQFAVGEVHDVLLGDSVDDALDLTGAHPTTGCDELTADVLGDGGCAI